MIAYPAENDYAPYYGRYIGLVPQGDILRILDSQIGETLRLLGSIDEKKSLHRYASDKWSIREVVGHLSDTERVFSYRALRISRNDPTPLAGFEQNDFVANGNADSIPLKDHLEEFQHVRRASLALFHGMTEEMTGRRGIASDNPITVRAIPFILAGHELHHRGLLQKLYL